MDWDSHYMPPEHYEPSIEFDFYTFFDGIEVCYHWEEGYLTDEDGEEVDLETHPHADEIQAYIEQNLWEISLPEDPHEEAIDNHIVSFVPQINKGTAVWQFLHVRTIPEDGDWGDTVPPTNDLVKRAYEQLGNPFISVYPQWKEFERFEMG